MSSPRWERRKIAFYDKHEKACRACSSKHEIHLHHHTYNRLGHEHDDDLVPLCKTCHFLVHKLHKNSSRSLTSATKYFVESSGGTFRTSRVKQKPVQRGRPGFVSKAKAAKILGVGVSDLPSKRHFKESTLLQWEKNPPKWLADLKKTPLPLQDGQRVIYVGRKPCSRALSWAKGKKGTVIHGGAVFWLELDDRPGSRLAITANSVEPVQQREAH